VKRFDERIRPLYDTVEEFNVLNVSHFTEGLHPKYSEIDDVIEFALLIQQSASIDDVT